MNPDGIIDAAVFTDDELDFINEVASSAFKREDRPYVLIGICGAILANIKAQSEGVLSDKELMKWVEMAMSEENLDPSEEEQVLS